MVLELAFRRLKGSYFIKMEEFERYCTLEDNEDDDWYYDSITRFKQLQMFEFDSPITHIDFSQNDQICVAGKIRSDCQEIQEFLLPEKKSTSAFESSDLKMKTGGFSTKPVFQMKCLRNQRKLITAEESSSGVSIYELGCESSDYIRKVGEFSVNIANPHLAVFEQRIAFGSSSSNIHLADIISGKMDLVIPPDCLQISAREISGVSFRSSDSLAYCESQTGKVMLMDLRSQERKSLSLLPYELSSDIDTCHSFCIQEQGNLVGVISSHGHLSLFDIRGNNELPVFKEVICIDSPQCSRSVLLSPLLLFSPSKSDMFSISSVEGGINVHGIEGSVMKLVFSYDGHRRKQSRTNVHVTNHMWSPANENLLYSTADDGSFHCWQFINNKY